MTPRIINEGGTLVVIGDHYRVAIEHKDFSHGRERFAARLDHKGFGPSWSCFSPAPGHDTDEELAELALALFCLGENGVDPEFFSEAPGNHFDKEWIRSNVYRESWMEGDREALLEALEARAC